ncbi:hypothetical protein ACROYT_G015612 [Oculina patagonica]
MEKNTSVKQSNSQATTGKNTSVKQSNSQATTEKNTSVKQSNSQATTGQQSSGSGKAPPLNQPNNQAMTGHQTSGSALTANQPNMPSSNGNPSSTSVDQDHCYSNAVPPKKRRLDPAELATNVAAILPPDYQYKCIEFEDLPGMMQDSFKVQFCIKDITCKEEVDNWLSKLAISSNIKYNTESDGRARSGKRVSFARWYICQCKRKKLTKKQEAAKAEAQKKKQFQKQPHPMNTETNQLDLLSKNRDKKTDCGSKLSIKIFTKRTRDEMCEVELWWNHNHSVNSFHLQSFCPILLSTKAAFEGYFENGMSASEAFHHHERKLMQDSISIMLLADRKYCLSLTDVNYMYGKWQLDRKGPPNGQSMFNTLAKTIEDYNNKNATKGGKCFLQTFEQSENSEQPLIVAICTPLMSRVHQLRQTGEMAFLDASGSLDRFNNPVYFMCTNHPAGALPLGVWITSGQSQYVTNQCLEKLQNVLPPHAFGGRGPKTGPQIFMTDDDSGQRGALSDTWKDSLLLLCTFHFLQAVWRWLFNSNNNISKEDRQHPMGHFQKLVFAASQKELKSAAEAALTDKLTLKYSNYQEYLKKSLKRQEEWALCHRQKLITRGNNTDNYTESMINIFKSVILHRMRAYNLIELFKFITEDLEMYFQRQLLALAFGKTQNLHLAPRTNSELNYEVDCRTGMCSCLLGSNGNPCAHQAAVALKYGIAGINFIPQRPEERFSLAKLAIGDHKELQLQKFVHLHQNQHAVSDMNSNDYVIPMDVDSAIPPTKDDISSSQSSDKESGVEADIKIEDILRLHRQVQDDIELKLKTTDKNFRACYMKYLEVYRKIISKARSHAPVVALATAFVNFGKDQHGLKLPILHNSRARIRVQPTSISRRKSKIKTSVPQPSGRKLSLKGVKEKATNGKHQLTLRKTASNRK